MDTCLCFADCLKADVVMLGLFTVATVGGWLVESCCPANHEVLTTKPTALQGPVVERGETTKQNINIIYPQEVSPGIHRAPVAIPYISPESIKME